MGTAHALLTDQFLAWVAAGPRDRDAALAAWRSSCPRLAIWEDSLDAALVALLPAPSGAPLVVLTAVGAARLREARATAPAVTAVGTV
jgi:hypothetical protein